jgi:YD repeat-containing protein
MPFTTGFFRLFDDSHDGTGSLTKVQEPTGALVTMSYDNENRLRVHQSGSTVTTYACQYDGMKRTEAVGAAVTTLVWDGSDCL